MVEVDLISLGFLAFLRVHFLQEVIQSIFSQHELTFTFAIPGMLLPIRLSSFTCWSFTCMVGHPNHLDILDDHVANQTTMYPQRSRSL